MSWVALELEWVESGVVLISDPMRARTIFGRRNLAVLLGVIGCLAAAAWLYDRHYFAVRWPTNVQQEVLGTTAATAESLISKERHFSQYGEGFVNGLVPSPREADRF
jgi:hypothetical protein